MASPFTGEEAVRAGFGGRSEPGDDQGDGLAEAQGRLAGEAEAVFGARLQVGRVFF